MIYLNRTTYFFMIICTKGGVEVDESTIKKIEENICEMMDRIIERRVVLEPFNETEVMNNNPFGYRLVPIEIWKGAKFERSFVTSLGQKTFEQLAKIIAEGSGASAENQYAQDITINTWRKEKTDEILAFHRQNLRIPNWEEEINEILSLQNNRYEDLHVVFDLYIQRINGQKEFYSMKTVKPNLDQTEVAKRSMLYMQSYDEDCEVYFALPYNPAGEGNHYRTAHTIPYRIFNMDRDDCVLIGADFWNKVGDNENTYNELLKIFDNIGKIYSNIIRKNYLGLNI